MSSMQKQGRLTRWLGCLGDSVTERTGRALERVKYRIDFEDGLHTISQLVKKDWQVVASYKKFRDAVKALNELRGVKK